MYDSSSELKLQVYFWESVTEWTKHNLYLNSNDWVTLGEVLDMAELLSPRPLTKCHHFSLLQGLRELKYSKA